MKKKTNDKLQTPYELFGVECGDGWKGLLKPIFDYIEKYNSEHTKNPIVIEQVKEKFGQLRFYVNFETEELSKLIEDAECDSWETCELCGSKEHIGHTTEWVMTICHDCIKKNAVGRKNDRMWINYANDKKYIISHDENIPDKEIMKNERNVQ